MTMIYTLTIGFFLIFTLIGLVTCTLSLDKALDSLAHKIKTHRTNLQRKRAAKKWFNMALEQAYREKEGKFWIPNS